MAATIADVLRHLVKHAPDLHEDGRREFSEAIDGIEQPQPAAGELPQTPPDPPQG